MRVVEIFSSIEGEGKRTGELTTFIRLAGCNLRCSYCDTPYSHTREDGKEVALEDIIKDVTYHNVTITGGEPLIQPDVEHLITLLLAKGHNVNIETNGSVRLNRFRPSIFEDEFFFTMDYKLPSSGQEPAMCEDNLSMLKENDVIKFVAGSIQDLERMLEVIDAHAILAKIYVSPVFGNIEPYQIVDFLKEHEREDIIMQLQMHKFIWDKDKRGV